MKKLMTIKEFSRLGGQTKGKHKFRGTEHYRMMAAASAKVRAAKKAAREGK